VAGDSSVQGGGVLTGLVPGSQVAGYLLERRVGVGGTAAVFRARDERLGRVVALKLLTAELTEDEGFRKRFLREARAVAAVDHPHIIPVYEAGEADGVLFIAMRFVAGSDLRVVVGQEGGLSPERAAAFFSPVASALDAAHVSGLVHRDVKPANILVDAGPGRPEHVYLSDFGLARGMLSSSGLTRAGQFVGTPDYAAPEQISGRAVDGRADQYSLACVAYMLLTGSVLFVREQPMAVLYAHVFEPPPRVTKLRPDLPAAVDQVLAKALAKAPGHRYDSCGAFSDALREALGVGSYGSAWLGRSSAGSSVLPAGGPATQPASMAALASTASLTTPPDPVSAPPAAAATWTAVVTADRSYYDSVQAEGTPDAASIGFPDRYPPRRIRLSGTEARIGRRSTSRRIEPEIDLRGPPADPGVSRLHARLIAGPDGSWSVMDLGSTSGTLVNGSEIAPGETVLLREGDHINLRAWTMITMTCG
jgi:serine/threonine protein kinase